MNEFVLKTVLMKKYEKNPLILLSFGSKILAGDNVGKEEYI